MSEERQYVTNFTFPSGETYYVKDTEAREDIEELKKHGGGGSGDINVQSDWNQTDSTANDYIKNKPDIYTKNEIDQKLVSAMTYKGAKATVSELPNSGNQQGDVWHITADGSEWAWNGSTWEELGSAPVQSVNGRTGAVTVNEVPDATSATVGQVLAKTQYGPRWVENIPQSAASLRLLYDGVFAPSDPDLYLMSNLGIETAEGIRNALHYGTIGSAEFVDVSTSTDHVVYDLYRSSVENGVASVVFTHEEADCIRTVTMTGNTKSVPTFGTIPLVGGSANAVLYTAQSLSDSQKAQARTNVGAGTYSKPSGGIPKSDLASPVQTSLGKADTAVQPSAISDMATQTYVQTQIAAIPDELPPVTSTDNGKVLAVNNGAWSADSPVIVSGTDVQVTNAVNDYLTQYGVPLRLSEAIKQALLDCFENVAWINDQGQTYYDALYAALYPPKTLVSISAVFNQGSAVIYDTDSLDTLNQYLTVTAYYDDSSTGVVTNYTLSGTLTVGTSTITVTYGGKATTFNVTVTHATRNTTAEIAESGKILVRNGGAFPITNGCYTIKYDMPSSTNVLYPSGVIPTKSNEVIYGSGASAIVYDSNGTAVNYVNEFDRWAQEESGTLTDFSQSWTLTDPYSKIAFSLDERYLDRAYMYDKTTGHIWFAGVNTPYYGMSNISEASA